MKQKVPSTRDHHQTPSASALAVTGGEVLCIFCDQEGHTAEICITPIPIDQKRAVMSKERRCYKCAKRNHRAAECRTSRWLKCAKCSGRHATGVCELNQRAAPLPSSEGASAAGVTVQSSLQVERTQEKARVLLQTARAFAEGENKTALVRMLLDGGSQRTFILEEVSRRLKLHIIGEERLTIYAFGSQRPLEERRCRRVECWLKNWRDNTRVRVEALEIPEISGDLLPPPDDRVAHLVREQGLVLADTVPDGYQPGVGTELLVGADHYWDVTTGSVKRVNERLVAVETVLGMGATGHRHNIVCLNAPDECRSYASQRESGTRRRFKSTKIILGAGTPWDRR
ncbi:hypothetical protein MTO96_037329 [Rhipicephalus appendiculatus]